MIGSLSARSRVTYPGANTDGVSDATEIVITESVNDHTLFRITHLGAPRHFTQGLVTGSPLRVDTSSRHGQYSWFGYVTDVKPLGSESDSKTQVLGVGITYPMKTTSDRVWRGKTVDEYAREMIYASGLVPYVEETEVFQTLPQAGMSDWELLRSIADMAGLNVFVTGSTVNALRAESSLQVFASEAAYLRRPRSTDKPKKIEAVTLVQYTDARTERRKTVGRSVDPITADPISAVSGQGTADYGSVSARSLPTLQQKVEAQAGSIRALSLGAYVEAVGNVLVGAGKPVFLDDRGTKFWWLCSRATHTFTPSSGTYRVSAELHRDSWLPGDAYPPPKQPVRNVNRALTRFCLCREHEPLLVNQGRGGYITSQKSSPGTEIVYADPTTAAWAKGGPLHDPRAGLGPPKSWVSLARWRARGKCEWP